MDHEGTEFQLTLVWFGLCSNNPIHKEKQLSINNALGTASKHALKFLLEDRKTLGQLKPNPRFLLRETKAKIQPLKHCPELATTTLRSLPFKACLSTCRASNQPSEDKQCTAALGVTGGHL